MKSSLEARLGPKVHDAEDDVEAKSVMSRVVVEQQKSREDVLAEETQKMDKKEKQRNRRMFGNLLGTLQKFKQDENRVKARELKKKEVEKKIEEKTEKEKEEAKRTKIELFSEKRKQQLEIKMLQIQMDRVQEYELWEKNKRREMQYIKTSATNQPQIFYMPREHNDKTMAKYEASVAAIEEEIGLAKAAFEQDLLKIESKMTLNATGDDGFVDEDEIHDDQDISETEANTKPKSVIVAQPHKRVREKSKDLEPEKIKVTVKNSPAAPEAKRIKTEKSDKSRKSRKNSSSSNDSSSDSDSDSSSSSSNSDASKNENEDKKPKRKVVVKTEKV